MKIAQLMVIVCLAGALLACGQKGPLVMPDAQKHKRTIPTPPGAPAKPASGGGATSPAPAGTSATAPAPPAPAPAAAPGSPDSPTPADPTSHP